MQVGDQIKAHLPGEQFWVDVTGLNEDGTMQAVVRNDLVCHNYGWGDEVTIKETTPGLWDVDDDSWE